MAQYLILTVHALVVLALTNWTHISEIECEFRNCACNSGIAKYNGSYCMKYGFVHSFEIHIQFRKCVSNCEIVRAILELC